MSKVVKCFVGYVGKTVVFWKDCQWTKKEFEEELRGMGRGYVAVAEVSPKEFREIKMARARM